MKKIPVFVLTVKNTSREAQIRKRLNFLKINFKFVYAINGYNKINYKYLNKIYDKNTSFRLLGRYLTYPEISNAEGHLRICKLIIRKKINNAIIMEDDCYPSKELKQWLKLSYYFNNKNFDIIQLYHKFGLASKKPVQIVKNFSIYRTCFSIPYATCYQISIKACKLFVKKNKVITRNADWPIDLYNSTLKQFIALPFVTSVHFDHEKTSCQKYLWDGYRSVKKIKNIIPFYNILSAIYYILHIPFIFGKFKDYSFYKENYLLRKIYFVKNLFSKKYINLEKTFYYKKYYPNDLQINLKKLILKN